ncbi:hypothetical protein LCGC14_0142840 [marine sediment metagenome]|uniref:Uncharacterized protein n=1 Tax=marine sediment metagenome TaxID=412755 RepID=A0A0F9V4W8_9ZZZZ
MNRITLQPTIFINHPYGNETFGYRIYDDHGQTYSNVWDSMPDSDMEALSRVMDDGDETAQNILGFMHEQGLGIYIGDEWYPWDQIKHLFVDES